MFPGDFIKRLPTQAYLDPVEILHALEEPSPVSIRINRNKWALNPLNAEKVPWCEEAYYLENRPSYTLDPLFHSGCYYPQEASSMFLSEVFRQIAGSATKLRVLDLCAAPGGKSLILSDLLGTENLLISNETIRMRSLVLAETLTKWGVVNTIVTRSDPSAFGRMTGFFDIIVVDAPCSGEGMFRNETARNEWSNGNASLCSERQKRILMDVWPALREDGILVYSTCTFNPGENEMNIKWLIDRAESECINIDIHNYAGITEIDYEGIKGYGFHPGKIRGEGFFISAIRKKVNRTRSIEKARRRSDIIPGKPDIGIAEKWSLFTGERIARLGDELLGLPCERQEFSAIYDNLKVIRPGTKLASVKGKDFIPSHELALSNNIRQKEFSHLELNLADALAFLKRSDFKIAGASRGWNILTWKGVNMGLINNIGNRFNNYYPVEWRIRMDINDNPENSVIKWNYDS